jgi:hypothetical protein
MVDNRFSIADVGVLHNEKTNTTATSNSKAIRVVAH